MFPPQRKCSSDLSDLQGPAVWVKKVSDSQRHKNPGIQSEALHISCFPEFPILPSLLPMTWNAFVHKYLFSSPKFWGAGSRSREVCLWGSINGAIRYFANFLYFYHIFLTKNRNPHLGLLLPTTVRSTSCPAQKVFSNLQVISQTETQIGCRFSQIFDTF